MQAKNDWKQIKVLALSGIQRKVYWDSTEKERDWLDTCGETKLHLENKKNTNEGDTRSYRTEHMKSRADINLRFKKPLRKSVILI